MFLVVLSWSFTTREIVVYRDKINHNGNTLRVQMNTEIQADSVVSDTTSVHGDTRRETQFLKVFAKHTMLTPPQHAAHLVMSMISVGRDPKNQTTFFNGQNSTLALMVRFRLILFKILKFSGPSLPAMTSSTLQLHFLSGFYYDKW